MLLVLAAVAIRLPAQQSDADRKLFEGFKAADQNDALVQYNLGVCYANGEGVAKDAAEAAKWYRMAAEQNYPNAQYNLGVCYADGQGVAKDAAAATKWYRKAAEQRLASA